MESFREREEIRFLPISYCRKPLPKRYARQGLTPPADAILVPKQATGE